MTLGLRAAAQTAGLALTMAAIGTSDARASDYTVWACANGSGAPLSIGSWVRSVNADFADVQTTCAEPSMPVGAFIARARATSVGRPGGGGWVVAAAPSTRITALDVWWSWQVPESVSGGAIRVYAAGQLFLDPTGVTDPFDGKGRCCSDSAFVNLKTGAFGLPTTTDSKAGLMNINHQWFPKLRAVDGHGVPIVGLSATCIRACGSNQVVAQYQAYRVKTIVQDATPPTGNAGGLHDGLRLRASVPIEATASDVGGGVHDVALRVEGRVVQRVLGGAECTDVDQSTADPFEYNVMKPCPGTLRARLTLNALHLPDNEPHQVSVVATDAAGQEALLGSTHVALAAPEGFYDPQRGFYNPDLDLAAARKTNGARRMSSAKLSLTFVRGRRTSRERTVAYSVAPSIRGRITTTDGKPIAGARVWLASATRGAWQISGKALIASHAGVVTSRLPARMPSRGVRLVYFPHTDRNDNTSSPTRNLQVRATTTIQSDQGGYRNGDTLTFTGAVTSKHLIDHKSVYLQARVRGKWRTFATTEADAAGKWRMTYRFEATRRPTRYTFRAVIPSQAGYDWATGHSRSVRVLVTP